MAVSYGTYTITEVQEGSQIWTTTVAPSSPNYTFTISNLTGDSDTSIKVGDIIMYSYYRYTVLSISDDETTVLTGNRASIRGATGAASVTYTLIVSNLAIIKDKDGNLSPSSITVTAKSQTGSNAMENYTGRIKIETTTDNLTWTSRINEDTSTKTYTIHADTIAIRCSLYLNGGTATLLDQQIIPIVSDGADGTNGTNGADAYTVILTNENHTFAGNTTSALASEIECNVIAYKGTTQVASTIGTITGQPTGMTTSLLNNSTVNSAFKVTVTTSMTTKNGILTIPITVDGKTFIKKFTYSLTFDGEKGDKGDTAQWYYGELLTHTTGTATLPISLTDDVIVGAMYLNTSIGTCYKCTAISSLNATWTYAGNIAEGIEIVGTNLVPLSKNLKSFTAENLTHSTVIYTDDYCTITNTYGDTRYGVYYDIDVESGLTYTLSFQASDVSGTNINYGVGNRTPDQTASWNDITGGYKDVVNGSNVCTFTIPDTVTKVRIYFGVGSLNGTVTISNLKLETGDKATEWTPAIEDIQYAMKVATNYLSMDETGIMVADMNDGEQTPSEATGNNVFIDNTSVNIRDGQTTLASFGVDGMQIGLSNENHTNQDYHSWQMIDKDGNIYAYISDLRDKTGTATITEINASLEYQYGGEYYFTPAYPADSVISITINNNQVSSFEIKSAGKYIKTVPSPTTSDNTIITYTSSSSLLKAYTLGNRKENSVTGAFSFVEGYNNVGSGRYSHAEGFDNESSAIGSHSEGHGNIASGNNSHVEGGGNVASNSCAHAEGYECVASGLDSHAEGWGSNATGFRSHAEGGSYATAELAHSEGSSNARGENSHAEGQSNAIGNYSHAEGSGTANGVRSHAEGSGTANGELSHAEGTSTASGVLAHAQNQGTKASSRAQTAIGKYNIEDTADTYAFIIGNGTYDSSRSNALTVKWDGTITAANGFSTANTALTISKVISSTYMNDTQFNRIKAYKKNGMLYLCFNAEFTSTGYNSSSDFTTIGTISGWNAVFGAFANIPRQTDGSKIVTLYVKANGEIQVYSTTPISGWHRASICVPCSS